MENIISFIDAFLINNSFVLTKSTEKNSYIYNYCKKNNANISRIGFIITKENENISFWGFSLYINFFNLEEIIVPILVQNNLVGKKLLPSNVYNSFFIDLDFEVPLIEKDVKTEKDITEIKDVFQKFYNYKALPFFEKWKDLSVLYEYIKDKESREELSEILGQFWQFKKATILRLCNDPNYQSFMDNFVKRREEILALRPDSVDVQRYYNASKELKEVLDKTEPIYNL